MNNQLKSIILSNTTSLWNEFHVDYTHTGMANDLVHKVLLHPEQSCNVHK